MLTREGDKNFLVWNEQPVRCAVGRGGIGVKGGEGDGITPAGIWPLRRVLHRPDRIRSLLTRLPASHIAPDDGWCDAPNDPNYNLPIKLPYAASHENLWRDDALYDALVVIGYNDDPIVAGKGSAIFLHMAREDYAPTEGCVALARTDLLRCIASLAPGDRIVIA